MAFFDKKGNKEKTKQVEVTEVNSDIVEEKKPEKIEKVKRVSPEIEALQDTVARLEKKIIELEQLDALVSKIEKQQQPKPILMPTYGQFLEFVKNKRNESPTYDTLYKRIEGNKRKPDRLIVMLSFEVLNEMLHKSR